VAPIGAGGMGEVWRARDVRLDRFVAIKVLPGDFAQSVERKTRFEREAKTISQLNHPNICALYDVGDDYLVMELLEGDSLAARIERGPLPLSDILRYGAEIAEALDRAHRAGVVHRDLKPANVMITKSGAKLLDFGLAKSSSHGVVIPSMDAASNLPTQQLALTSQGTILGTFQYMAPEQLEGQEADPRTDIFALGEVLYEMATGKCAFEGKTKTSLIAAIVGADPKPISELRPLTPPALDHVITKCLSKDPDHRWQSAHDVAEELRWIGTTLSTAMAPVRARTKRHYVTTAIVAALALAIGALIAWRASVGSNAEASVQRLNIGLPPQTLLERAGRAMLAISPDGSRIVYGAPYQGERRLFIRSIDRFAPVAVPGTERPQAPFFSPDGAWVGFFADGFLKKVSMAGGAPITICSAPNARGGTWSDDGTIYFAPHPSGGIFRVSAGGGTPVRVSKPDASHNELSHRWPSMLPDGKHVLATVKNGDIASFDEARIVAISVSDGSMKTVLEGGMCARYLPTGHLVFARGDALYAVRFDPSSLTTSGAPVRIVDDVLSWGDTGWAAYAFSGNGSLVYVPSVGAIHWHLQLIDRTGYSTEIANGLPNVVTPRLSPDERTVAIDVGAANDDIDLVDIARGLTTRLSFEAGNEGSPVWTPDGLHVLYSSELPIDGTHRILMRAADGSGQPEELMRSPNAISPWSVSADGKTLALVDATPTNRRDIWLLSLVDHKKTPLLQTPFDEAAPAFSPDAHWLAYESNESGRSEVYVRPAGVGGGRLQISIDGGSSPHWAKNGRELYYWNQNAMYAVTIEGSSPLRASRPSKLFAHRKDVDQDYDVTADGRFLFPVDDGDIALTEIHHVTNWLLDVKSRMK